LVSAIFQVLELPWVSLALAALKVWQVLALVAQVALELLPFRA
jgi:hypothetical protein